MSPRVKKIVSGLAVLAVLALAILWWEGHKKARASAEVKAEASDRLAELGQDNAGKEYFRGLVEAHHDAAFDDAYSMGGRRRSARFDEARYYDELLARMAAQASQEGRAKESAALHVMKVTAAGAALEGGMLPPAE